MPWPSSAVNSGPRRLSQAHGITETCRNSQPTCSAASCSSPADRPDVQSQAQVALIKPLETYQVQTAKAAPGLKRLAPYDPGLSLVNAWASVFVSNTCGARSRSDRADPSFRRMKALVV